MGGICRFAEQSAVFENYWADCFPQDLAVPTSLYFVIIPTDCYASLPQSYKHEDFVDLLSQITTSSCLGGAPYHFVIIPTDCSASLSQSCNHSEYANLLRKLLLPHDWAIPKKRGGTSCKHGCSLSFCNLVLSHHSAHACACWCCRGFFFNVCYYRLCCQ